jgi:hypothetical protein
VDATERSSPLPSGACPGTHAGCARPRRERRLAANRSRVLESILGGSLSSFSLHNATAEHLEAHDAVLILRYTFTSDHYAQTAGNLLLIRPRVLGVKSENMVQVQDRERKFPFELDFASHQSDVFEITLPPGFVVDDLPAAVELDAPFAAYRSKIGVSGNLLRYERTYEVKDVEVPSTRFEEFKKFYRQVNADERASAVMKRTTP